LPARRLLVVYDTANTLGFLVEAVEPPAEMPPTAFTA
jgi:hypothetical protein